MLVLERKNQQAIIIGDDIRIQVCQIASGKVKLGILAPRQLPVFREEIYERKHGRKFDGQTKSAG